MSRRQLIGAAAAWATNQLIGPAIRPAWSWPRGSVLAGNSGPSVPKRAVDLVHESMVIDMLGLLSLDWPRVVGWLNHPSSFDRAELIRLAASGIDVFHPAVEPSSSTPFETARRWIAGWNRLLAETPCGLRRVDSPVDLARRQDRGTLGVLIGFQSSEHFRSPEDVAWFAERGQRVSQLTYNGPSRFGSGSSQWLDRGLTALGAAIVVAMNDAGMAIDISHCGERTGLDAIELSRKPVLLTHANCRALVPRQQRNATDRTLRAMAAGGGVIGITTVRAFVGYGRPNLEKLIDHFDYVARLVGIEHVGLGSDVDVDGRDPHSGRPRQAYVIDGLDPARRVYQIADGLLRRGYRRDDVEAVLGGNFRRALTEIWGERPDAGNPVPDGRDPFCPPLPKALEEVV